MTDPVEPLIPRNRAVADTWERGHPYERYIGRWSREVAPRFLEWLHVPHGRRWLDVGCGTGALCSAILDSCSPTELTGVEPSAGFLQTARREIGDRATLLEASATSLPLADDSVDVTVSGLVLNFVPDAAAGLREMQRVTARGGTIGAYVWDYAGRMELIRHFWDAAREVDPGASALDEGVRFPLCHPEALAGLFSMAGLAATSVSAIDVVTAFTSFDDYWEPFLGGQGPAPAYAMALDEGRRGRLRDRLRARVPVAPDGTVTMTARAWAARGTVDA